MIAASSFAHQPPIGVPKSELIRHVQAFAAAVVLIALIPAAASAEVEGCNSERAKSVLIEGTFGKWKANARAELQVLLSRSFKPGTAPECAPFKPPYTGPEPQSGYVPGRGYRSPNSAPYVPNAGGGQIKTEPRRLTANDYLESHNRACAQRLAEWQDDERRREERYKDEQGAARSSLDIVTKMTASVINVRQQDYDKNNDVRMCAAQFQYSETISTPQALFGVVDLNFPQGFFPNVCPNSVSYKVEPLLDKPGQFLVSWRCIGR
jgi:hypothetical protein